MSIITKEEALKARELRQHLYGNKEVESLEHAKEGEYWLFVTSKGKVFFMCCIGEKEYTGYDYDEWCVSERSYIYTRPLFLIKGEKKPRSIEGKGIRITKEEYDTGFHK